MVTHTPDKGSWALKGFLRKLVVLIGTLAATWAIYANPVGGDVTSGNATITQTPDTTVINQASDKAIINWQSFNIGANEATHFQQPNANSVTYNRINPGQGPSQIYGTLTANGKIILVNQAGVYFGPTAFVNVGGIIASAIDMTDENFLAGKYKFDQPSLYHGTIINQGTIIAAEHGLVALVGSNVSNEGYIQANKGNVILASGNKFTVDLAGDGLINFAVDEASSGSGVDHNGNTMHDGVSNSGSVVADGGRIVMTASAASGVVDHAINMTGVAQAHSVSSVNGEIIFSAEAGKVRVAGKVDASGKNVGERGGKIKILAQHVEVVAPASFDVSGYNGGGEILLGGNFHGAGPEFNALTTYVAPGVNLNANALVNGNGGNVVAWGDLGTWFYGNITAQGGVLGGNGGQVETSGHYLDVMGAQVNTLAPMGITGTWLLDPTDVTITTNVDSNATYGGGVYQPTSGASATSNILASNLMTQLATSNVNVTTTPVSGSGGTGNGDITVATALTWSSANTLTLTALRDIYLNSAITATNGGLTLTALRNIYLNADITATNGGLTLSAVNSAQSITSGTFAMPSAVGVTANINVRNFTLSQGQWYQLNSTLPAFYASNSFTLNVGTITSSPVQFLRAAGGAGSVGSPYQLIDVYGLQGVGSNTTMLTKSFILNNDIDASSTATWNGGVGFVPIDVSLAAGYSGTFNGQNHVIMNLFEGAGGIATSRGVFGYISGGTVSNLGVTGSYTGVNFLGGIAGTISNATIQNSYANVAINAAGAASYIGGFVGNGTGTISNSYAMGAVIGASAQTMGGFIGEIYTGTTISNSFSTGAVTGNLFTGGFVGNINNAGVLNRVWSSGLVTTGAAASGLVGSTNGSGASVTASYWDTTTSGKGTSAGGAGAVGLATAAMMTQASFSGWDFTNVWNIVASTTRPFLRALSVAITGQAQNSGGTGIASELVRFAVGGVVLNNGLTKTAAVSNNLDVKADGSGNYTAVVPNSAAVLGYIFNDGSNKGNLIFTLPASGSTITGMNIKAGTLKADSQTGGLSNTALYTAIGSIGDAGFVYSGTKTTTATNVPAINIAGTSGNLFTTTANGYYVLGGNLTTTSANLTFNNPILSSTTEPSSTIQTLTSGNITLSSISWVSPNTLTVNSIGNIALNGPVSMPSGSLALSAANTAASITTGASGTVSVKNFNLLQGQWSQVGTLPAFSVTNNFQLNSGNGPVSTVQFIRAVSGNGSGGTPYQLTDIYGVQGMNSNATTLGLNYVLNNLIDASGTATWNSGAGFKPIGNTTTNFTGSFDGQNNIIDQLSINRNADNTGIGLFGVANANLSNLILTNLNINSTGSSSHTGGLVGNLSGGTILNVSGTGSVVAQGAGGFVGGLAGIANQITSSSFGGTVIGGTDYQTGGLAGQATNITNSYSTATVIGTGGASSSLGGLAGKITGTITTSYSSALLLGSANFMGSIAGSNGGAAALTGASFWDSGITTAGFSNNVAFGGAGSITGKTTAQLQTLGTFTGWSITATPSVTATAPANTWFIFNGGTRPILMSEYNTTVSTPHQLQLMGSTLGGSYTLAKNIDLSNTGNNVQDVWGTLVGGTGGFVPVGNSTNSFSGTFNGQNYVLDKLYINNATAANVGLFGLTNNPSISNVRLLNATVTSTASNVHVGGIAGRLDFGLVSNVNVTGTISGGSGSIIGGVVGYLGAAAVSGSNFVGTVTGNNSNTLGGLVGYNVSSSTTQYSYSTATVNGGGSSNAGGLIGYIDDISVVFNSYSSGVASGATNSGAIVGYSSGGGGGSNKHLLG